MTSADGIIRAPQERASVLPDVRQNGNPQSSAKPIQLAQFEFGTGFLLPETGAIKRALETMSPHRDRKSPAKDSREMAAKAAFLLMGSTARVSEDWVVVDAV
jgi:hypothetical protein